MSISDLLKPKSKKEVLKGIYKIRNVEIIFIKLLNVNYIEEAQLYYNKRTKTQKERIKKICKELIKINPLKPIKSHSVYSCMNICKHTIVTHDKEGNLITNIFSLPKEKSYEEAIVNEPIFKTSLDYCRSVDKKLDFLIKIVDEDLFTIYFKEPCLDINKLNVVKAFYEKEKELAIQIHMCRVKKISLIDSITKSLMDEVKVLKKKLTAKQLI
jgi:hypothetical protein